jgi:L-alanine-DL-glutamate epimerase-like enolase superfamily enzyme
VPEEIGWQAKAPAPQRSLTVALGAVPALGRDAPPIRTVEVFPVNYRHPIAKAGIDLALHDVVGKMAGKSVAELWGRKALARTAM